MLDRGACPDAEVGTAVLHRYGIGLAFGTSLVATLPQWPQLRKQALEPRHCRVARAVGASMEPTLPDGSSILVDLQGKEFRDGAVFVASTSDGVVARRAAKFSDGRQLVSDDGQSAPVRWQGSDVIGGVRWMGKTL